MCMLKNAIMVFLDYRNRRQSLGAGKIVADIEVETDVFLFGRCRFERIKRFFSGRSPHNGPRIPDLAFLQKSKPDYHNFTSAKPILRSYTARMRKETFEHTRDRDTNLRQELPAHIQGHAGTVWCRAVETWLIRNEITTISGPKSVRLLLKRFIVASVCETNTSRSSR